MSDARQTLGRYGEDLACQELERRGYAIIARRYRRRTGAIDIVARDGPPLVFVEVKARDSHAFGAAADAVTALKRRRMKAAAIDYMMRHRLGSARAASTSCRSTSIRAMRPWTCSRTLSMPELRRDPITGRW